MPYPTPPPNWPAIPIEGMDVPMLAKVAVVVGAAGAMGLLAHTHSVAVCIPGHFNKPCKKCIEICDLEPDEVEHLYSWPIEQREQFRQVLVEAMTKRQPVYLRWMMRRAARKPQTIVEETPDGAIVTFQQVAH